MKNQDSYTFSSYCNFNSITNYEYAFENVTSHADYYPFGMQMPGRNGTISGGEYRYAFNGMETDKEVSGQGNSYTTQFRQYDPRLGRWKSLDPLAGKYPSMSPFVAFNNNPIFFVDPLGLEGTNNGDAGGEDNSGDPDKKTENGKTYYKSDDGRWVLGPSEKIEVESKNPNYSEKQKEALKIVYDFEESSESGKWSKIDKAQFAKELRSEIRNPNSINQASTNLCGIAAGCNVMAQDDPVAYANMSISLFVDGEAEALTFFGDDIEANESLMDKKPQKGLSATGFVVMTSIRDSYNWTDTYSPETDKGRAGFTYPSDVSSLLYNFADIYINTTQYTEDLSGGIKALNDGMYVIALFDFTDFITGVHNEDWLKYTFGTHYVVINSIKDNGNGTYDIEYWQYGNTKELEIKTITKSYYDKALKDYIIAR